MTWAEVLRLFGTTAFAAVIVALIQAVNTRRKLGSEAHRTDSEAMRTDAETDQIITNTARDLVRELRLEAVDRHAKVERLEARVAELERERETNRTEISSLRRQIEAMISDRDDVVEWVGKWREWFMAGAKPPPPPVPRHLRDVIPEWTADDLDRSTDHAAPSEGEAHG